MNTELLKKLTIAIPVYNDEKYIRQTVESCIGQAAKIIIYDNASTDGTPDICAELARRYDNVEHMRHAQNVGAFENFRISLFDCETEYFCWLGSHDILAPLYSLHILTEMEKNPAAALGTGKIVYIDEEGAKTGQVTQSRWTERMRCKDALDRSGICAVKIKDCFLFYNIQRTARAQAAWFNQPSLGFDRAYLCKLAAEGEFIYAPEAVFFARDFDKTRKTMTTNDRRAKVIGKSEDAPISKDLLNRNKSMVLTVLDQAANDEDLGRALGYIDQMNRRYSSRRKFQRKRILHAVLAAAGIALVTFLALR